MGDTIGVGFCAAICNTIVASIQMTVCMTNNYGATCCKPLDTLCRCKCCWKQGDLPTDDYPDPDTNRQAKQLDGDHGAVTEGNANSTAPPPAYQPTEQPKIPTV